MLARVGDRKYRYFFLHEEKRPEEVRGVIGENLFNKYRQYPRFYVTTSIISTLDGEELSRGVAVCSPLDHYDRVVGRKIAMHKAVAAATNIPDSDREAIFRDYQRKLRQPRGKK